MKIYIALLRGINVSGKNIIKMADLRTLLNKIGFSEVTTYIQSGNILFKSDILDNHELESIIQKAIFDKYGYQIPVLVKSREDWKRAFEENPFQSEENIDTKKMVLTFLSSKPIETLWDQIIKMDFGLERYHLIKDRVYIYCHDGYGNTKLSNSFFETKLKQKATTRNWNTISIIMKLSDEMVSKK